jgi:hypothetical protein
MSKLVLSSVSGYWALNPVGNFNAAVIPAHLEHVEIPYKELARNARDGNLGPDRFWLLTDQYFRRSTIYRLIAPMAAFKILQRRLTSIVANISSE